MAEKWTWQGNVVRGTVGISARKGIRVEDPHVRMTNGIALPTSRTPSAKRPGDDRKELDHDIRGVSRPKTGTVGAIQVTRARVTVSPLQAKDVGPHAE